jgi:uncharacterized membrane-anchored protein
MAWVPAARFVGARSNDVKRRQSAPAADLEPFLHRSIGNGIVKGHAMITMGIGLAAGVFYWLGVYKLAFWILVYAITYGALGALRGDNHTQLAYRRDSGLVIAVLIPVAWHIGRLAGYL